MKTAEQQMPQWLTRVLFAGLALVFVLMPLHAFISTWGGSTIGPLWLWKSWKEIVLVGLLCLIVGWLIGRPLAAKRLFSVPFVWVLVLYVLVSMLVTAFHYRSIGSDAVSAGLAMNFRYLLAGIVAYSLFCFGRMPTHWLRHGRIYVMVAGVTLAVLGVVQALALPADFLAHFGYDKKLTIAPYATVDNNIHLLRAFATLRGPNDFGAFLILPLLFVLAAFRRRTLVAGLSAAVMVWALILSGSRSAWLGAVAALATAGVFAIGKRLSRKRVLWTGVAAGMVLVLLIGAATTVPTLRTALFHSSAGDSSLTEGSTDNHVTATASGLRRVVNHPLGCGVGCAGPASYYGTSPKISENYFVQIAEETGVIGVVLFVAFVGMIGVKLYSARYETMMARLLLAALIGYGVIGLLLHVWADDPLTITWWALAGAVLGYNERQSWKKKLKNN